jgi:hypothetical protein
MTVDADQKIQRGHPSVAVPKFASFLLRTRERISEPRPTENHRFSGVLSNPKFARKALRDDGTDFGFGTPVTFPPLRWIVIKRGLGWNVEDAETAIPAEIDGLLQAHIKAHEDAQSVADMLNRMDASKLKLH